VGFAITSTKETAMKRIKVVQTTPNPFRLASLTFAIVLALGLIAASTAFAEPEFNPTGGAFNGEGVGSSVFTASTNSIECTTNKSTGTIASATLVGGIVVTFTGCKSNGSGGSGCTTKSTSGAAGEIITNTLHGVLGLILPKGSGTGVGLLLLPVTTKKWYTLASTQCTGASEVLGNLAGEFAEVGAGMELVTNKLTFLASGGTESIKDFDLSSNGALIAPRFETFGETTTLEAHELISSPSPGIEIT
jgi:hypothetical protein